MKTFGYTSRDKSGALNNGTLQAVDRIDALRQIKSRGCVPVAVTEGKSVAASTRVAWNPAWSKTAFLAATAVILIAAVVLWLKVDRTPVSKEQRAEERGMRTTPRASRHAHSTNQTAKTVKQSPQPIPAAVVQDVPAEPPAKPDAIPAAHKAAPPAPVTQTAEPEAPKRPNTYKSATEGLLSMAMSIPPGELIPPLPISADLDADFANSLTNVIVVYDDDDAHAVNIKENVAVAKNQLLEQLKAGQSVSEVLKAYEKDTNERASIRIEAQQELNKIIESGSQEEAAEYVEKVNKAFAEIGVEPISLPRARKAQ